MKKITQPKIKTFIALCEKMLIDEFGAEKTGDFRNYTLVIKTRIGPLSLRVDADKISYDVFGYFKDNEDKAKKEFGHWKYNSHIGSEHQPEEAVELIKQKIQLTQ